MRLQRLLQVRRRFTGTATDRLSRPRARVTIAPERHTSIAGGVITSKQLDLALQVQVAASNDTEY